MSRHLLIHTSHDQRRRTSLASQGDASVVLSAAAGGSGSHLIRRRSSCGDLTHGAMPTADQDLRKLVLGKSSVLGQRRASVPGSPGHNRKSSSSSRAVHSSDEGTDFLRREIRLQSFICIGIVIATAFLIVAVITLSIKLVNSMDI